MPRIMAREAGAEGAATTPPQPKKFEVVIALLRRREGASVKEMVAATGWLPHTTRAALTGLRKKGHVIDKATVEGVTRYIIAADPVQ